MADLTDNILSDNIDRARTSDIFDISITCGAITIGTSASVAKVGASNLINRKAIVITNTSSNTIYWGASNVTTSIGTPIKKDAQVTITVSDTVSIYLIAASSGNNIRIVELA